MLIDGRTFDAHSTTRPLATNIVDSHNVSRTATKPPFSPRVAAIYQIHTKTFRSMARYSRSFRAPTLNELYRGFRVGNVVTQANENLTAEHANTFEGGCEFHGCETG